MEFLKVIFSEAKELNALQMSLRTTFIFFYTLLVVRIAGRRSFALSSPFDNIISLLMGACLGGCITGAIPFVSAIGATMTIALLHRFIGLYTVKHPSSEKWIKGEKIILFKNNQMIEENLLRCLVSRADVYEQLRSLINKDSLEEVDSIYMEKSGKISVLKK